MNSTHIGMILLAVCISLHGTSLVSAEEPSVPDTLAISIDTDKNVGPCYRFWTVNVFTSQHQFLEDRFARTLKDSKPTMESVNCVRLLGGRHDQRNNWFKGVDEGGKVKTDFTDLVRYLKAIVHAGYKPRLVLDNVPTAMSTIETMNTYGNTNPPDDEGLWRQYITKLMRALVDEFGAETVTSWRMRVGTEPDLYPGHWTGTKEEYLRHYDVTVDAVTKVVPQADIGPGNILNPMGPQRNKWGLDIIDHCAGGTNAVTGEVGTRMTFFGISFYGAVGRPLNLQESIGKVRDRLDRYPHLRDVSLDIQEFGILSDEHGRRLWGNDITEWGASWYAAVSDVVYQNNIAEVYEWSQTTGGLPHARLHVNRMLEMMAGGGRVEVNRTGEVDGRAGAIACVKDDRILILIYNHHPQRDWKTGNTITITLKGSRIAGSRRFMLNQWTIDRDHGVWAHEMYRDCEKAGLKPLPNSPIYGGQPQRRFGSEWFDILADHREKYEKLASLPRTITDKTVSPSGGELLLTWDMPAHGVRLIELVPLER